jgi:hypothetical protein
VLESAKDKSPEAALNAALRHQSGLQEEQARTVAVPDGLNRLDAEFWLRNRAAIIEAVRAQGLNIVSTASGVRLMRLGTREAQDALEAKSAQKQSNPVTTIAIQEALEAAGGNPGIKATNECDALRDELESARQSAEFYQRRCDALQQWQSRVRDPERTIVCDILANGGTLEPAGNRYTLAQQAAHPDPEAAQRMGAVGGEAQEGERLAFEAWMRGHCWALCATWTGKGYQSDAEQGGNVDPQAMRTRQLWAAWRDRAALARQAEQARSVEHAAQPVHAVQSPSSTRYFTVVYRNVAAGDEARALGQHPKAVALSWSHALHDRDDALADLERLRGQAGASEQQRQR